MYDETEGVHDVPGDADVEPDQISGLVVLQFVVETRISPAAGLEQIEEVQDDLGQRQVVFQLHPVGGEVLQMNEPAPLVIT